MQRYWWPGYKLHLLEKLQRQQNNSQFCDTLLQTDGISIPTHSCILAALSPYLSERLLASPSPPFGQKRLLKLHTVKDETLLKLVALIYSGEVEVNVGVEQNDLLATAMKFGITDLIEGQKQAEVEERCHQRFNSPSCEGRAGVQDAQGQAEMVERRVLHSPVRATRCASASALDQKGGLSKNIPAQNADFRVTLTPKNLNIEDNFNTFRSPQIPSIFSESTSDDESELNRSLDSLIDPTAPWPINVATTSFDGDLNSRVPQECSRELQSPLITDTTESGSEDQDVVRHAAEENSISAEQPCSGKRAKVPGEERVKSVEERSALAGRKNLDLMKQMAQMVESTQISIKVKLVRTQGEVWEVANMQNTETLSVLSSLKQTTLLSSCESSSLQSSPASKPETPTVQPAAPNTSGPSPQLGHQLGHGHVLNQGTRQRSEESDEEIEVLLEDIVLGLNVLPSEERSCRNPLQPQPSQHRVQAVCAALVSEEQRSQRDVPAAAGQGGCVYHQNYRTQDSLCSTDTDQTQSICFSPSSLQCNAPQCRLPHLIVGQPEASSPMDLPTVESQSFSFAGSPTPRSVRPAESISRELSTQDLTACENKEQSFPSVSSVSAMDDLHLPQCLSPLRPLASAAKPQLLFKRERPGYHRHHSNLCSIGQPLLTENPKMHQWNLPFASKARTDDDRPRMSDDKPKAGGVTAELACKSRRLRCLEDAYVVEGRDGVQTQIHLNPCSVSLSSNNVLAKEREMAVSSSGKSKGTQNVSTDSSKIRTRGFLKKIQEASCQTKVKCSFVSKPSICRSNTIDNGEVAPLKRKRGRPLSKKGLGEQIVPGASEGHPVPWEQQGDHSTTVGEGGVKKTKRKWRRTQRETEAVPQKRTRRAIKAETREHCDVALTTEHSSPKRTRKMKRMFAQHPNSTVTWVNRNKDKGTSETERQKSPEHACKSVEEKDAAEKQDIKTTATDENFNLFKNTRGHESNSSSFTDEVNREELQCDVLEQEVPLPAETTELLQNLGEAQRLWSDSTTPNNTLPQGDKSLFKSNLNAEDHNRIPSSPMPQQGLLNSPSHQDHVDVEGEDNEEEEVEVVLYSPVPQARMCENKLDKMDTLDAEKLEEEECSEVDVTGDDSE